jgi:hypothetical protein
LSKEICESGWSADDSSLGRETDDLSPSGVSAIVRNPHRIKNDKLLAAKPHALTITPLPYRKLREHAVTNLLKRATLVKAPFAQGLTHQIDVESGF